jgi:hypothetical protein
MFILSVDDRTAWHSSSAYRTQPTSRSGLPNTNWSSILKAAKTLDLTVPASLLAHTDEVIE